MLTTLNGMFSKPKPHRVDFIKENKKRLKEISSMVNQDHSKSRFEATKGSQTDVNKCISSGGLKEIRTSTRSGCRLGGKGSMGVFFHEKKNKKSISNVSLSAKQKSSQKLINLKNQSCQTIDPRRCDQLFHEGIIKYPSSKVLLELAEVEKQRANRLDVHVKKDYFRRYKVKPKNHQKSGLPKNNMKVTEKGDENPEKNPSECEDEDYDENEEEEVEPEPEIVNKPVRKPVQKQTLRAAEIIKETTENHVKYNSKNLTSSDHTSRDDIKGRKKSGKKFKENELMKSLSDPQCPPGHIPLPDPERKKTLHMLRVSHAELVKEMNLLPVRTDTLRIRQKKMQLENQLNKIEEGIKVFNKSKVYVKIEE